jgi:hypothetical protein
MKRATEPAAERVMFLARHYSLHAVTIFHPPDLTAQFDDLLASQLLFVWDDLQDPACVFRQIGRHVPFAPAVLPGFVRVAQKTGDAVAYRLDEQEGAFVTGYVLLGLAENELLRLDEFAQVPIHRIRHGCRVRVGDLERVASVHLASGSYLGE